MQVWRMCRERQKAFIHDGRMTEAGLRVAGRCLRA